MFTNDAERGEANHERKHAMEVRWMSRDFDTSRVLFWTDKPELDGRQFEGEGCIGMAMDGCIPDAPIPGQCVPITAFEPVRVTRAPEPEKLRWLCCSNENTFYVIRAHQRPSLHHGGWRGGDNLTHKALVAEVAELIMPNHNLQPGQCIEVPPRGGA